MSRLAIYLLSVAALLIVLATQQLVVVVALATPPTPIFADNYRVEAVLSLPYAELNEPFSAWYDKKGSRSRTDYYGDLYKVYQFGPQNAPEASKYGAIYKLVYVPASFHPELPKTTRPGESLLDRVHKTFSRLSHFSSNKNSSLSSSSSIKQSTSSGMSHTRRACFSVLGSVGGTIEAQTVLPTLNNFEFDSIGRCPHVANEQHRHAKCELWRYSNEVGDKKNTYKMWVRRDSSNSSLAIPVHYYMLGYDSLLGSHYDRYDVSYFNFKPDAASDSDFAFDAQSSDCGSMPGPGDESSSGARRSHMIVQNPIHEYVSEPHRYDHIDHEFERFKEKHQKDYDGRESHERKGWHNFLHNFRFINGKNRELKSYKLGVNSFADNNLKELSYLRGRLRSTGYNGGLDYAKYHADLKKANARAAPLPDTWDWSIRGAVTPVKDQAVCGSCWSFGTSGTLEGAYFVKTGKLPRLSQQQMVDCSWEFGNNGCDGGEDFRAYKYIMEAGGLSTEEDYGSYLGVDGKCHDKEVEKAVKISGFYNVTSNDVEALKHAIVTYGPVTVAIDASRPTFTFYSHGVYYDEKCNNTPDGLDHQVLAVGYTKVDGKFVWLIKNSWSTHWGNNGYILISAENNNCGVMDAPTVPIIKV